jgi:hypothetical protein
MHLIGSPYRKIFGQSKRLLPAILGLVEAWEGVDYGMGCKEITTKGFDYDRRQMTTLGLTHKPSKVSFTKRPVLVCKVRGVICSEYYVHPHLELSEIVLEWLTPS